MAKDFCEAFQDGNIDNLPDEVRTYIDSLDEKESVVILDVHHMGWETEDGSFKNDSWTVASYDKVMDVIISKMFWEDIVDGRSQKHESSNIFGRFSAESWLEKIKKMEESA